MEAKHKIDNSSVYIFEQGRAIAGTEYMIHCVCQLDHLGLAIIGNRTQYRQSNIHII